MIYVDAGWLDPNDHSSFRAPVCSSLLCDADGKLLPSQYNQRDEVLQIMFIFACVAQDPSRLVVLLFRCVPQLFGHAFNIEQVNKVRLAMAGGPLIRSLHWGERGAIVSPCTYPYTETPFVLIYDEADYEKQLFVMADHYCRLLDRRVLTIDEVKGDIGFCFISLPSDWAWFIQRTQYKLTDLNFEMRVRQTHRDPPVGVLVRSHNVEHFATRPHD